MRYQITHCERARTDWRAMVFAVWCAEWRAMVRSMARQAARAAVATATGLPPLMRNSVEKRKKRKRQEKCKMLQ